MYFFVAFQNESDVNACVSHAFRAMLIVHCTSDSGVFALLYTFFVVYASPYYEYYLTLCVVLFVLPAFYRNGIASVANHFN